MTAPQKIGRYEIQGELGRGAMGIVYRALDPNIGRTVALKTMRLDVHGADEEEILRRFKHEAKLAGVINHPNVVTIYDAGEDQRIFYIAMEHVEGVTLQTLLHQQKKIPAQLMLEITRQICPAMDYAHKRGVIHRDIKPANIMLTSSGGAKIMDFGIAKAEGGMTSAGQVLGTPAYMSPEQVRGKTLDGRSDLFSYGVVLYEMVTGEKPFTGQNVTTIIYKIMNEAPVPPRDIDLTIHPGISAIITKALAKDPNERFQKGSDLLKQLESYKDFGSDADQTQVLTAADEIASPTASTPPAKKSRQIATLLGGKTTGKGQPVQSIESTVTVQQKASAGTQMLLLHKNKIGIAVAALVVVLFGTLMALHRKNKAQTPPQQAQVTTPAPNTSAPTTAPAPIAPQVADPEKNDGTPEEAAAKTEPAAVPAKTAKKPSGTKTTKPAANSAVTVPAPPPEPEFGSMHVTSTPEGASVTINGESKPEWVTPFTAEKVRPGELDVTFNKQGFSPQKRHTTVTAGKLSSVGIELATAVAKINVRSTPTGANILLDGSPTGKVTPAVLSVDPGAHKIVIRQQGYQEENTSVTLKDGESYDFAPTLEVMKVNNAKNPFRAMKHFFGGNGIPEGQGMVQVQSNPPGAEVVLMGKAWPKPTPARSPVDPGTYQIIIRKEGYKPVRRELIVEKGKVADVVVELEPK